jgi:hypothetical protein
MQEKMTEFLVGRPAIKSKNGRRSLEGILSSQFNLYPTNVENWASS